MIETHDLSDVWRNFNKDVRQYTWVHARDNLLSLARLDKLFVFKHTLIFLKDVLFLRLVFQIIV